MVELEVNKSKLKENRDGTVFYNIYLECWADLFAGEQAEHQTEQRKTEKSKSKQEKLMK